MAQKSFRPPRVESLIAPFMINKALNNPRRYDIFHPSAWGSCLRKMAYQYYNEKFEFVEKSAVDIDMRMERIFDNGHHTHARWQDYIDRAGFLRGWWKCTNPTCGMVHGKEEPLGVFNPSRVDPEFCCPCGNSEKLEYEEVTVDSGPEYNFRGNVDAIVDVRGTPHAVGGGMDIFVVDFKTMRGDFFLDLVHAKWDHVVQTHVYMWLLELQAAVVLYENKNSQELKELFVPRDDRLIERIKKEAKWLKEVLSRGKLPPRPSWARKNDFPCRFCEFAEHCYE